METNLQSMAVTASQVFYTWISSFHASFTFPFSVNLFLSSYWYTNGNPGIRSFRRIKTGWPIIGETWDFMMAARCGIPEKFINDRVSKYSPEVFQTSLLGHNIATFWKPVFLTPEKEYYYSDDQADEDYEKYIEH
ncbi:hypothetical protein SADUNF_Sadunf19G0084900 [Salix dunnii]|uniref:Uncharacterized protein n=1 Tax=Salix dunnii TaxID=1413687 RepID=A0A835J2Q5_9ROSI|nr:hypothetical protein SADUNF_Sadunf19G0084900 [Salix dunnii]